jgi:quercetin dioxygenase-like cupin family protein
VSESLPLSDGLVVLRDWNADDAGWYAAAVRDPEIQRFTSEPDALTARQVRTAIADLHGRPDQVGFVICDVLTGERLGMGNIEAPPLTVVQPGEGRAGDLGPIGVVFKLWGHDTGGALSIVEHPFDVGALVPPHMHTREDAYSIVTEGEIGFRSGDREVVLGAGGYITKPRGELHAMWNAGHPRARSGVRWATSRCGR